MVRGLLCFSHQKQTLLVDTTGSASEEPACTVEPKDATVSISLGI